MTATDERTAMLRAICANRDDDTPRLVFADWLDEQAGEMPCPRCSGYAADPENPFGGPGYRPERDPASGRHEGGWGNCKTCNAGGGTPGRVSNGFGERAEFIRVQVELAKVLPADAEAELLTGGVQRHLESIDHLLRDPKRWKWVCGQLGRLNELGEAADWWGWMEYRRQGVQMIPRRGLVSRVVCDSASWLRVADEVAWSPTMPCPRCKGEKRIHGKCALHASGHWGPCPECVGDDGGAPTGTVPRPFVPTAQPLSTVTLTTNPNANIVGPDLLGHFSREGGPFIWYDGRWDWIEFMVGWELPPG